jgi:histidyl-tRNA synthetase
MVEFFRLVGLTPAQVRLQVNNRRLVDAQLTRLGLAGEQRAGAFKLIDKREKLRDDAWRAYALETVGLSPEQFDALRSVLENTDLWRESPDLVAFFEMARRSASASGSTTPRRSSAQADYYTGTVYEARPDGEFARSWAAGAATTFSDVMAAPRAWAAIGDVIIELVSRSSASSPPCRLAAQARHRRRQGAVALAARLRAAGLSASCPEPTS